MKGFIYNPNAICDALILCRLVKPDSHLDFYAEESRKKSPAGTEREPQHVRTGQPPANWPSLGVSSD